MSGTFPTEPGPATVTLESDQPTVVSISESKKGQSRIIGGHLWRTKFSWSRMTHDMLAPIFAFAHKQRGRFGSFQIVLPNYASHTGDGTGTIEAFNAHAAGVQVALTDGWSGTTVMKANDVFKFASHSKVYMLTIDSIQSAGYATLTFEPPLIQDIADNDSVIINGVEFTMSFDDDIVNWKGSAPDLATISANMTERL